MPSKVNEPVCSGTLSMEGFMNRYVLGASLAVAVTMTAIAADGDLKSGEQKPSMKISAFNPLHCSGKAVGSKNCLV